MTKSATESAIESPQNERDDVIYITTGIPHFDFDTSDTVVDDELAQDDEMVTIFEPAPSSSPLPDHTATDYPTIDTADVADIQAHDIDTVSDTRPLPPKPEAAAR